MRALWVRDPETSAHSQRVANYALRLSLELKIQQDERDIICLGALLHDLGKIGFSDSILLKRSGIDEREWNEIRSHPSFGGRVLHPIPGTEPIWKIIYGHHERPDGQGYPEGVSGEELTLGMRVVGVVDAFDAMVTRTYRPALTLEQAIAELRHNAGTQFDPDLVRAFVRIIAADMPDLQLGAG